MLSTMYTSLFILSLFATVMLIYQYWNRITVFYVLLFAGTIVINYGYMQMSHVSTLDMAIMANQTVYLGTSFCPFFLMMCLSDLCKVKINKIFQLGFVLYGLVLFWMIFTIKTLPIYYKNISFVYEKGAGNLIKDYGPLHILYPIYLLLIIIVEMIFIIKAFRKKQDVSYITSSSLLSIMLIMVSTYSIERSLHLQIEILPVAYVIGQYIILYLLKRISLYDITAITGDSMMRSPSHGFALFDSKGRYLGADFAAKIWFPELKELYIDEIMKSEHTDLLMQVGKWLRGEETGNKVYIEIENRIIKVEHTILREHAEKTVHCIYLWDDTQQQRYTKLVEQYNEDLEKDVHEKTKRINQIQEDIIISMASIVENRDSNTGGHIARTRDIVRIFVTHLQKTEKYPMLTPMIANSIIMSSSLHDFGKIAIPDEILNKPGKFTLEEYKVMQQHPAKGAVIVAQILQNADNITLKNIAVNVAHYHHEKWDGTGYPDGLKKQEIPFEARIMAMADVFDALVSRRVYKERFGYDKAFAIIEESCGTHFDPDLCREFLKCRPELERLYDSYED